MLLDFYTIGFVIAFIMTMHCLQEDNRVGWLDIIFSTFMGVTSWIGVLALLVGRQLRKNGEAYNEVNNNDGQ